MITFMQNSQTGKYNLVLEVCGIITCEGRIITRREPKRDLLDIGKIPFLFFYPGASYMVCLFCKNSLTEHLICV